MLPGSLRRSAVLPDSAGGKDTVLPCAPCSGPGHIPFGPMKGEFPSKRGVAVLHPLPGPLFGLWGPIWKTHREASGARRGACCCPRRVSAQTCPETPHTHVDLSPTRQDLRVPASERAPGFGWATHRGRCFASRSCRCCLSLRSLSFCGSRLPGKGLQEAKNGTVKSASADLLPFMLGLFIYLFFKEKVHFKKLLN